MQELRNGSVLNVMSQIRALARLNFYVTLRIDKLKWWDMNIDWTPSSIVVESIFDCYVKDSREISAKSHLNIAENL